MPYITKIKLSDIAKLTLDNSIIQMTNYYLKKIKRHCQDNIGVYHIVFRNKTRDKIATMYNMLNYI